MLLCNSLKEFSLQNICGSFKNLGDIDQKNFLRSMFFSFLIFLYFEFKSSKINISSEANILICLK